MAYYVSNGQVSTGINLSYNDMFVLSGGTANNITVNSWGELRISSGGLMNDTTVNYGGEMYVSGGATANSTTVNNGGTLDVLNGGVARNITVNYGGELFVHSGGKITGNLDTFPMTLYVEDGSIIDFDISESIAPSLPVASDLWWISYVNYPLFPDLTITITVSANQNGGVYDYYSEGNFDDQLLGMVSFSIGTAEERFGSLTVNGDSLTYGNCTYKLTYDKNNGHFQLTVTNGTPEYPYVISGAVLTDCYDVSAGYRFVDTTVNSGGKMNVQSGGLADSATVNSGGYLRVSSGGKVTGPLTIANGATVSMDWGSIIDFDISGRPVDSPALVNDLSRINNFDWIYPDCTITVSGNQANGIYRLADGAGAVAGFTGTVSLGTDGANYGTINVDGNAPEYSLNYQNYTFTLSLSDGSLLLSVTSVEPTPISAAEFFTGNFNGAGTALHDVVLYQENEGGRVTVLSDTGTRFAPFELGAAGDPWKLIGVGDFNADGVSDVLWRNMSIGDVGSWLGDGSFGVTWQHMAGASVGEWEIVGVGDFNADSTDDVLWYNTQSGLMLNWQVQNGVYSADAIIAGAAPGEWRFSGVGDFNGDGTDDILWHNQISGAGGYWALQNGTYSAWRDLAGADPEEWTMIGIGDFDANGYDDVLWLNNDTGLVGCWANNSTGNVEWNTLAGAGDLDGWHYSGVGDFDSDGRSDVLWAHDGGAIGSWITATDRIAVGSWLPIA